MAPSCSRGGPLAYHPPAVDCSGFLDMSGRLRSMFRWTVSSLLSWSPCVPSWSIWSRSHCNHVSRANETARQVQKWYSVFGNIDLGFGPLCVACKRSGLRDLPSPPPLFLSGGFLSPPLPHAPRPCLLCSFSRDSCVRCSESHALCAGAVIAPTPGGGGGGAFGARSASEP